MTRLALVRSYLQPELYEPPFPIHVVASAVVIATVALGCTWLVVQA